MQTAINPEGQTIGVAGQLADNEEGVDIVSAFNEDVLSLPFGCGAQQGTTDQGAKVLATANDHVIGVNLFGLNHYPGSAGSGGDLDAVGLMPGASLQLLRRGRVLARLDNGITVAPEDRAWCRFRTDGGTNPTPGTWAKAQDGGNNLIDLTKVGVFRGSSTVSADGATKVAILEVDFTSKP